MKSLHLATILAFVTGGVPVIAAPAQQYKPNPPVNDGQILNYALTLEHLENTFYQEGLNNFTAAQFAAAGFDSVFYSNLQKVSQDETAHVNFLSGALRSAGIMPVAPCTYAFDVSSVEQFIALASVLEGVGVSAYLGAAAKIANKNYLTAAGSILTIESRHIAYLRSARGQVPFPSPFDAPLTLNDVYSLATQFISSCPPSNPPLPLRAFPPLILDPATTQPITAGSELTFFTPKYSFTRGMAGTRVNMAFIAVTGPVFVPVVLAPGSVKVTVPAGFSGQTYAVLTTCNETLIDEMTYAGPALIEVS